MLSYLSNMFTSDGGAPSVIIFVRGPEWGTEWFFHIAPEDRAIEAVVCNARPAATAFRRCGTVEQSREALGTVKLDRIGSYFIRDVRKRAEKIMEASPIFSAATKAKEGEWGRGAVHVNQLAEEVLRPAALEAIREWEQRDPSMLETAVNHVYLVYVKRPKPGSIDQ